MSLWLVVISLLVGVLASAFVPIAFAWVIVFLLLSFVILGVCYFRELKFEPVFFVCCVLIGWSDSLVHQQYLGEEIILPSQKYYHPPTQPSENVVTLEACLASASLGEEHRAELNVMMFGDKTKLSQERRSMFRLAGAQHLLALSGTHLGVLLAICYLLFLRRVRYTRFYLPVLVGVLGILWFYTLMVGAPQSLRRAMLMATLFLLGQASFRSTRGDEILATTIFLMLLLDPLSAFDIGAELSVTAVTGIVFMFPLFYNAIPTFTVKQQRSWHPLQRIAYRGARWIWGLFCVSLSAWLLTMPLVLFHFGQIQPWQILTGVILVPTTMFVLYVAVFVLGVCFVGWMPLITLCSGLLERLMVVHDWLLARCGELPYACVRTTSISAMQMVVLYGITLSVWYAWSQRTRRSIFLSFFYITLLLILLFI